MSPLPHDQLSINSITNVMLSISHKIHFISPLPHYQLPINSITKVMVSISYYKHPYVTPPTRSVTNQFHYQYYAVHLTLNTSFCHPSHMVNYQSIPLPVLWCPSHTKYILMSPLPHDQLPTNSITNNYTVQLNHTNC
jgi:hypothetical protein